MQQEFFALVFGGIIGVLFKYWYDYKAMVYKELWQKRYGTYTKLLQLTGALPLYPEKANLIYKDLFTISEKMRDWYFEEGGLLLSMKTRNKYFEVQKKIQVILKDNILDSSLHDHYDIIRDLFSELRTELTNDLMSRNRLQDIFGNNKSNPGAIYK
ncbi:MAG: hypothetical protein IPP15_16605 [Saprospiraceae bacterium]|uniref:Uncharacterized protein n=1 Tax=Candidatus Opimibacter skivensis TaxID=2982028 RepID=A0A9D7SXF5_9BACT|nr:hypothetical protein [Candidatus Opimibacter skivensis]